MKHALADLEGGGVTGVATPLKIQKLKKVIMKNKKTEEMIREKKKKESVERFI